MPIVNLTPHAVNVGCLCIPPSGQVARCATSTVEVGVVEGITLSQQVVGEITDLPHQQPGVWLLVSAMVRCALPGRKDLVSPGDLIRDDKGVVIGCKGFICNL